jgi:hypothetical protein
MSQDAKRNGMNYKTMPQIDVPQGRKGKHHQVIGKILSDLDQMKAGNALKVPLDGLSQSKERVRSALNRATRKRGTEVATASDDEFLYIWNVNKPKGVRE